jgi:hypothetical protein
VARAIFQGFSLAAFLVCALTGGPAFGQLKRSGPGAGEVGCTVPEPELDSDPEWEASKDTMSVLIATGDFEIRGSYRLQICGFGLSVYVLQNADDRQQVYECVSDDRYRPAFPCQKLMPPETAKKP